jgi:hypothetical protein
MHTIQKSQVDQVGIKNIQQEISKFANEYRLWLAHMMKVNSEENAKQEDPEKKYMPYKPPLAHPLIMSAVDKLGNIAYEFIDDTVAISSQTVRSRREELMAAVVNIENEEIAKIIPRGKIRLWEMKQTAILNADGKKRQLILEDFYKKNQEVDHLKLNKHIDDDRDPEDTAFLEDMKDRKQKVEGIQLWAAQLLSDIEDLSNEAVFDWKVPSYKS